MTETVNLEAKLRQVAALLNRAEHPNTPVEEAKTAREMAEKMMAKYRLEEERIRQERIAKNIESIKPIISEMVVSAYSSEYRDNYLIMLLYITDHVGNVRYAYRYDNGNYLATLVGFESDVRYVETLYTALRLHFANTLEPTVDPTATDEDNVYRLRTAGIERPRIGELMGWGRDAAQKVTKVYKRACEARGEHAKVTGKSLNVKLYRESFAKEYVRTIDYRLRNMRQSAGSEMLLAGRKEAVDAAFYETFPHLAPSTPEEQAQQVRGGPFGNCPKCKKAKSGYCREHGWMKPKKYQPTKQSELGRSAGREAAESADLGGTATSRPQPLES